MQNNNDDNIQQDQRITSVPLSMKYTLELNEEINSSAYFISFNQILRNASSKDVVELRINGNGGSASPTTQLINNIRNSEARVHGVLEGCAISAHSLIYLSCDSYEVSDNASILIHDGSVSLGDSHAKLQSFLEHSKEATKTLFHDVYKGFLSVAEIDEVLSGKDIWLSTPEIKTRLENKVKLLELEQVKEDNTDKLDEEHSEVFETVGDWEATHTDQYYETERNK